MPGLFDAASLEIPCENCGRKTKQTIGWIKTHEQFTCPCGTVINLKADQFRRELAAAEAALVCFQRALQKPGH